MSSRSDKRRKTKVKKSSEKVSEKPKLEDGEAPTTKREPIKTDPERIELLQKRLNDVSSRSHKFAREIERLRAEARKHTFDADKMIKWLEEQVKRKDMANKKLTKHLKEFTELQENEKKMLKKQYESTLKRAEQVFLHKESQLLERNKQLMQEVSDLSLFKKMRFDLAQELGLTKTTIHKNEVRHKDQLDDLQKKFILAEAKLRQEAAERIAHSRKVYKEEVGKELDLESKQVRQQNIEMSRELKFHESRSNELKKENEKLFAALKRLKIDVSVTNQKEQEYAKRGLRQSKQIKDLSGKVKMLERSLTQVLRDFELERESKEDKIRKLIGDKEHEIHTLQQHNVLKNREVATIKKHAQALLGQRGEVEHFFLEALEQVKNEIREKREYEYRQAKYAHNRQIRQLAMPRPMQMTMGMKSSTQGSAPDLFKLPTIPMDNNHSNASTINNNNNNNTTHSTTHSNHSTVKLDDTQPVAAPKAPSNRVDLKDLTPEDRERVLRLLFAKINNAPPKRPVPAHSFDIDIQVDSNNSKNQHNRQAYAYDDENDENSGGHQNHSQQQQQQQYTKPLHLPPPPSDSDFNYGDSDMNSETHNDGYGSGDQKNDGTSDPSFFLTDHDENSGGTFLSGVM